MCVRERVRERERERNRKRGKVNSWGGQSSKIFLTRGLAPLLMPVFEIGRIELKMNPSIENSEYFLRPTIRLFCSLFKVRRHVIWYSIMT